MIKNFVDLERKLLWLKTATVDWAAIFIVEKFYEPKIIMEKQEKDKNK